MSPQTDNALALLLISASPGLLHSLLHGVVALAGGVERLVPASAVAWLLGHLGHGLPTP